jgi:hypothetical protein
MELLDRYLQAVRFWLPKAQQEDIIAELSSDLSSQIEEKEGELGRPLTDAEVEAILKRCGSPILVAARYRPRTQLIGPALFPIYESVLKITLFWMMVPIFVLIVGPAMILPAQDHFGALLAVFGKFISAAFITVGIMTIVFALLERGRAKLDLFEKWDVKSLPPVVKEAKPRRRTQSIFELIFSILGLLWLLAVPFYPFLMFGPAAIWLKPGPALRAIYYPILALCIVGLASHVVALVWPKWGWFPPLMRLMNTVFTMLVLYFMLAPVLHSGGAALTFIVSNGASATSAAGAAQAAKLAAIVNASMMLGMGGVWIGLSIGGVKQTWELLSELGGRSRLRQELAIFRHLRF